MKVAAVILCSLAFASAAFEPGLIAKACFEGEVPGEDCRYTIPKTVSEALNEGWTLKARNDDAYLPGLGLFCPSNDYSFCVLYDQVHQEAAGVQIALPVDGYNVVHNLPALGFDTWTTTLNNVEVSYWTSTVYLVASETAESSNGSELIRDGLWVPDNQGNLMELPRDLADLSADWSAQGCIDSEGTFYFYELVTDVNCEAPAPWFAIYHNSTLVGSGFFAFGTMPTAPAGSRVWLEQPTIDIIEVAIPDAPQCIYDLTEAYGTTALGVMYISNVAEVVCAA